MTEYEALRQFGLIPKPEDLPNIKHLLADETTKARTFQGNEALLRLLCIQLFAHGSVEDSLLVWRAKRSNFDSFAGIDVQLMCGAGLEATQEYLRTVQSGEAGEALQYLSECERAGDFKDWSARKHLEYWRHYYKQSS